MSQIHGFDDADDETLKEIMRQAESYLGAQLSASIAADQRALAFASVLGAAAIGISGGGFVLLLRSPPMLMLGWTCVATACGLLAAMALANLSAMPAEFWFAGNSPDRWASDVQSQRPLKGCLSSQLTHYTEMIADNNMLIRSNCHNMSAAIWIAWLTLAAGGAVAIVILAGMDVARC